MEGGAFLHTLLCTLLLRGTRVEPRSGGDGAKRRGKERSRRSIAWQPPLSPLFSSGLRFLSHPPPKKRRAAAPAEEQRGDRSGEGRAPSLSDDVIAPRCAKTRRNSSVGFPPSRFHLPPQKKLLGGRDDCWAEIFVMRQILHWVIHFVPDCGSFENSLLQNARVNKVAQRTLCIYATENPLIIEHVGKRTPLPQHHINFSPLLSVNRKLPRLQEHLKGKKWEPAYYIHNISRSLPTLFCVYVQLRSQVLQFPPQRGKGGIASFPYCKKNRSSGT